MKKRAIHNVYVYRIHITHVYTHRSNAMKEILTVTNRRGGTGKTATTHAIGAGLSLRGYKILYVDLDSQCNLSFDIGAKTAPLTSMEVLTGTATAQEAIQNTQSGDIIAGSPSLATADISIEGTGKEYRLKEALEPVTGLYDYIVIDTPPSLGILTINALTAATSCIIPAQAEIHSIQGIGLLHEAITAVQKYTNPELTIKGILITRFKGRTILSKDMRDNLEATATALGTKLFSSPIRECISVQEAQAVQQDIFSYAKRSNAAADYTALIEEILEC